MPELNKGSFRRFLLHTHFLIAGILHIAAKDHRGVFWIKLHHVADTVQLLAGHQCGAGAAEGINNDRILLRGVLDRIAQKVERLEVG